MKKIICDTMPAEFIPGKSFIEVQFPVSKISKESYKERKATSSQTLSPMGKWWGRKPLILCRAAILGLLLPATDNPLKDREIFLKLLTMDNKGLLRRKNKNILIKELANYITETEQIYWFDVTTSTNTIKFKQGISRDEREHLQEIVFSRMGYDEKIRFCNRPEQIDGPSIDTWEEINNYLGTHASSLPEFIEELGIIQFGTTPSIGDCFCGGGNIPYEGAQLGCDVYASDLSPVAALLTWAALHIVGGGRPVIEEVKKKQEEIFCLVDKQITEWGIEHNQNGWRAYAYLYCNEIVCPECGWKVPLLPTLLIAERMQKVRAELVPDPVNQRFEIIVVSDSSPEEMEIAKKTGTFNENSRLICPNPECTGHSAPISLDEIRREGEGGLRLWVKEDFIPKTTDVFQDRLYAIRWEEQYLDNKGKIQTRWHFRSPTKQDIDNEEKTYLLLKERLDDWQKNGIIPSTAIEEGYNTSQVIRERGWTHWHHIFTPRQLLINGLFLETIKKQKLTVLEQAWLLLAIGRIIDWNSKLCRWSQGVDLPRQTFDNQALNPLYNFGGRGINLLKENWMYLPSPFTKSVNTKNIVVIPRDSRLTDYDCIYWITDPPYADAINYHELSEFFLSWYNNFITQIFPSWYNDSKRALAIRGSGLDFKKGMIDTYRILSQKTPDNGAHIVMFTHQDASVWANLAVILWSSGFRVTSAWCITTETDSALKKGNYVQGTVLLVLRKQTSNETAFLDEIYPEVESEVKRQLDTMLAIDDKDDPNFGDTDYQLAAYAAALRVLTKYKKIEEIDIEREIARLRQNGEKSPLEKVIENAVKIACDHLVPKGIDSFLWKQLGPEERFYLKGLELESHGEYRIGAYQELARGFGIRNYRDMQESGRANETRLRTASEFKDRFLRDEGFGSSLVRQVLFAVRQTQQESDTAAGKAWLRGLPNYWDRRKDIIGILQYLASIGISDTMPQWQEDAKAARLLAGAVEQDHV